MHQASPYVMFIKIYNKLPKDIINEEKFNTFDKKLKDFLWQKCYYHIYECSNVKVFYFKYDLPWTWRTVKIILYNNNILHKRL